MVCLPSRFASTALLLMTTALLSPTAFAQSVTTTTPPAASAPVQPAPAKPADQTQAKDQTQAQAEDKARADRKAILDAKLAGLHAGLQLTPAQAPLWAPVESAVRDIAAMHAMMAAHRHEARAHEEGQHEEKAGDQLERLKRHGEWAMKHGKAVTALADATGPLLAALTSDQKDRLPRLIDGMQSERLLRMAFNLPRDADERHGEDREAFHHGREDRRAGGGEDEDRGWHGHHRKYGWDDREEHDHRIHHEGWRHHGGEDGDWREGHNGRDGDDREGGYGHRHERDAEADHGRHEHDEDAEGSDHSGVHHHHHDEDEERT